MVSALVVSGYEAVNAAIGTSGVEGIKPAVMGMVFAGGHPDEPTGAEAMQPGAFHDV